MTASATCSHSFSCLPCYRSKSVLFSRPHSMLLRYPGIKKYVRIERWNLCANILGSMLHHSRYSSESAVCQTVDFDQNKIFQKLCPFVSNASCYQSSMSCYPHDKTRCERCWSGSWERATIFMVISTWTGWIRTSTQCSKHILPVHYRIIAKPQSWHFKYDRQMSFHIHLVHSAAADRRVSLLRSCSVLLAGIRRDSKSETLNFDFTEKDVPADLNGHYASNEMRAFSKRKNLTKWNPYTLLL